MDLISKLPEHLVHRILYFLPTKDVLRTSCLSKTWRIIRSSYTTVSFIQWYFDPPNVFKEFMKNSLQSFIIQKLGVQRFKLRMTPSDDPELTPSDDPELNYLIDQWINYVAKSRVEEVNICINQSTSEVQPLHSNLPAAGILLASKTLITLSLYGCELEKSSIINLPHLQKLVMQEMDLDDTLVQNLVLGCPLLEDLKIERCNKLTRLQVSNLPSIKKIWVAYCYHLRRVEVIAPSLETLVFTGSKERIISAYEIDLAACETTLKDLHLSYMKATSEWLQDFISKFVCLETLRLLWIPNLETIKVSSPKLKKFSICRCLELGETTEIDAPLLHELDYSYNKLPFYNISTSNLEEVDLYFNFPLGDHGADWFNTLKYYFRKTRHIQKFRAALILNYERDRLITHELTDSVFLVWEQLKHWDLEVVISTTRTTNWFGDLLFNYLCRFKKIYIAGDESGKSDLLRELEEAQEVAQEVRCRKKKDRAAFGKNGNGLNKKCKTSESVHFVEAGRRNLAEANQLKEEDEEEEEEEINSWIPLLKAYHTLYNNSITCVDLKWIYEPLFGCMGCLNCRH